MVEMRSIHKIFVENLRGMEHLECLGVDMRVILKPIL
jgi:hypothetical protein